jgi:hypothetical protein
MDHLHCQDCGAHFTNRAELDGHNCRPGRDCAQSGQVGELPADAAGGRQHRPAGSAAVHTTIGTPNRPIGERVDGAPGERADRRNRVFTRSHRE